MRTPAFRVSQFLELFQDALGKSELRKHLTSLVVQQDEMTRLRTDEGEEAPIASISYTNDRRDNQLLFDVFVLREAVVVVLAGGPTLDFPYKFYEDDNKLVTLILDILKMIISGQISLLLSIRGQNIYASEILIQENHGQPYQSYLFHYHRQIIGFGKRFTVYFSNNDIHRGNFVPVKDYMVRFEDKGPIALPILRPISKPTEATPLTDKIMNSFGHRLNMESVGGHAEGNLNYIAMLSWEYWLIMAAYGALLFGVYVLFGRPESFPFSGFGVFGAFAAYPLVLKILEKKEKKHRERGGVVGLMETRRLKIQKARVYAWIAGLMIVANSGVLTFESFVDKNDGHLFSAIEFIQYKPIFGLYLVAYAVALVCLLKSSRIASLVACFLMILGSVWVWIFAFIFTNIDADIPGIRSTIAVLVMSLLPFVGASLAYYDSCLLRFRDKEKVPSPTIPKS